MPQQFTENILSYHDIVANSFSAIINALSTDQANVAKKIILFNIQQAYTLCAMNDDPRRDPLSVYADYRDMVRGKDDINELTVLMFAWQSKAGIKPVQEHKQRAHIYERLKYE